MAAILSDLKAEVADDLTRGDISSQIASAITAAIVYYQDQHFYFSETRASNWPTVNNQSRYTVSDSADIPLYLDIEKAFISDASDTLPLLWMDQPDLEPLMNMPTPAKGRPTLWSYYEQSVWLYPVPGAVYTFRPLAMIKKAAPASDSEMNNVWMTEAYALIKARAKMNLAIHVTHDDTLALKMKLVVDDEVSRLRRETNKKASSGSFIKGTSSSGERFGGRLDF